MANWISNFTSETDLSAKHIRPLENAEDLDPLMHRIGDAKYVLLGEASHGTHEYYTWRAEISKRLIEEKGFSFVAVEGDWPDCYKINRWVKDLPDSGSSIEEVLKTFKRWPTWMWANWEVAAFAEWMKSYNSNLDPAEKVGFYGLDVYSLWESMEIIVNYLEKEDPETATLARRVAECFEPYRKNDSYATAYRGMNQRCRNEVVQLLTEVRQNIKKYNDEREADLNAELNTLVMKNAEKYYEAMASFDSSSWNVRDSHMVETLNHLMNYHDDHAKVIIWEHNTHIGDARATDMAAHGMHNVGQLVRQQHQDDGVVLVGFGSYQGSVMAGEFWGGKMKKMELPKAIEGSVERLLHQHHSKNQLLIFDDDSPLKEIFQERLGHRAVGVVYDPHHERGNYVPSRLSDRYDAFLYIDKTKALHPLHLKPDGHLVPETYPFGI
ncbi:Erythromycin esterase homolog [Salinimicrobium catena]|uniref:Erythromycin esterase homolog n=1 Tax=Salinimicrobium catena TaxID=390640 RepID=A0A1H5NV33_9FLAO|nr:erythromycin esterase family protein [Salinimicrobium catena]SDL60293.1 Erythromycin esterase homolog [Salinimicrobium catena]SEF05543.1 Erythromycin esterase homolog [Salinimicrobium catena]